jgi:hypothetical protein
MFKDLLDISFPKFFNSIYKDNFFEVTQGLVSSPSNFSAGGLISSSLVFNTYFSLETFSAGLDVVPSFYELWVEKLIYLFSTFFLVNYLLLIFIIILYSGFSIIKKDLS